MEQPVPTPAGIPVERRKVPRRAKQVQILLLGIDPHSEPVRAWVLDLSLGGMRLRSPFPFPPSMMLKVMPAQAPADAAWVPIRVKNCKRKESTWELSCQFIREPSYSTLLQFS